MEYWEPSAAACHSPVGRSREHWADYNGGWWRWVEAGVDRVVPLGSLGGCSLCNWAVGPTVVVGYSLEDLLLMNCGRRGVGS